MSALTDSFLTMPGIDLVQLWQAAIRYVQLWDQTRKGKSINS